MEPLKLDQFWRCPVCDSRFAMGDPAKLHPPICNMGHARTEMEQTTAQGFNAPREDEAP